VGRWGMACGVMLVSGRLLWRDGRGACDTVGYEVRAAWFYPQGFLQVVANGGLTSGNGT